MVDVNLPPTSHIAISDEKGNVRSYREGGDKTRVQLLVEAIKAVSR